MRKTALSFLVLILLIILSSAQKSEAIRKESFLGKMVDSAKRGAVAIKQDVDNYNTFIVSIDVFNESSSNYLVEIYNKRIEHHPHTVALMPVYSEKIGPNEKLRKEIELKAYLTQRDFTFVVFDNEGSNGLFFDPSKKDLISYTIK